MSNKLTKAPSTTGTDKKVSDSSREQNKKENKNMHQFYKALSGVIFLILKICLLIAIITLMKMPQVHFIIDLPFYQIVSSVLIAFILYLELYEYFVNRNTATKSDKKKKIVSGNPLTDGLEYLQH